MYCVVAVALQEAKLSVKRLRAVFFGRSRQAKTAPAPVAAAPAREVLDEGTDGGKSALVEEHVAGVEGGGCDEGAGASQREASPKATGGPRPGTGRLGAEASGGAERVECRHAELAVGQRCPVCGQGTFYALPPGVEMRSDGHALLSAIRYE
jgi:hypothetical protein